ncbi:hypothetical protein [Stenotrophomonas lactitubi]|uniref:hypothetical protein n=1 Tax=Stenotrophomonas lactitubi TaxID=2045214 RepID=UPI00320B78A9
MLNGFLPNQLENLGVPIGVVVVGLLLIHALRWSVGSPTETFHRWRESKQRAREFLLKLSDHASGDVEARWIKDLALQEEFRRHHGMILSRTERLAYLNLLYQHAPTIKWRHIKGISQLAHRSSDGDHIELRLPKWERIARTFIGTIGLLLYLFGSALWLLGLPDLLRGAFPEIVAGVLFAILGAVTTRWMIFPVQSYREIAKACGEKDVPVSISLPVPKS